MGPFGPPKMALAPAEEQFKKGIYCCFGKAFDKTASSTDTEDEMSLLPFYYFFFSLFSFFYYLSLISTALHGILSHPPHRIPFPASHAAPPHLRTRPLAQRRH
jgi:hypothetical protein